MATSNSTNFAVTRDQIISGALRLCGTLAMGESPTTDQINESSEALNMLVKSLQADGMQLWAIKEYSVSLVAGQATYNIGIGEDVDIPKPLKIYQAYQHDINTNVDVPMRLLTRDEYNRLGNKESSGTPIQFYYDVQRDYGTLKLFPVPSAIDSTTKEIKIIYQRPFEDFDASSDNPDFPQEWFEVLKYGLATRLAGEYGITLEDRKQLLQEYILLKNDVSGFGTEEGSFFITPRMY